MYEEARAELGLAQRETSIPLIMWEGKGFLLTLYQGRETSQIPEITHGVGLLARLTLVELASKTD